MFESKNKYFGRKKGKSFARLEQFQEFLVPPSKEFFKKIKPVEKFPIDRNVTATAITIPKIPNKLPCLDVSGDDKPLKAKINNTPDTK